MIAGMVERTLPTMRCRLCLEERELRRSHIYSELLYKPLLRSDGVAETRQRGIPYVRSLRKGVRERLLCDSCEKRLGEHEDYFAKVWYQQKPLPDVIPPGVLVKAPTFAYAPFKLFHLAQLWRASIASTADFAAIRLGPHEERIRQMISHSDPGAPETYPLRAAVIVHRKTRRVVHGLLAPHAPFRENGARAYAAIYGGCAWRTLVASKIPEQFMYFAPNAEFVFNVVLLDELKAVGDIVAGTGDRLR